MPCLTPAGSIAQDVPRAKSAVCCIVLAKQHDQPVGCVAFIDDVELRVHCLAPFGGIEHDSIGMLHHLSHMADPFVVGAPKVERESAPEDAVETDDKRIP